MASWFLPQGRVVVTEDYGGKEKNIIHRSRGYDVFNENLKMVVLINGGSASASEILAGALKADAGAVLVGSKSFGKGTIQDARDFDDGSGLHITIAKWLTPDKKWVHNVGLTPDVVVEPNLGDDGKTDAQLEKALELARRI